MSDIKQISSYDLKVIQKHNLNLSGHNLTQHDMQEVKVRGRKSHVDDITCFRMYFEESCNNYR